MPTTVSTRMGRETLLPLAAFDSGREHLENVQHRFSQIVHHAAWLSFWNELVNTGVPQREAVRFIAASQPHAGDVLNAIPMRSEFRVPSWAMRVIVQRRLGLPLEGSGALGPAGAHTKDRRSVRWRL